MKREARLPHVMIFVFLLALAAGCQRADVERAAAVGETKPVGEPAATGAAKAGVTAPAKRGAEARAGNGVAVAKAGEAEARAGNGKARARAGDVVAENGKVKVGDVVVGDGEDAVEKDGGNRPGKVRLKIGGRPGAEFSGTCAVGDEGRDVSGRAPARFSFEPEGRELSCEIRNGGPDAGPLKFSVDAGGGNRKQKIKVTGESVSFTVSGNSISHTVSSSSASGSAVQKSSVSSSYSNSSVSSSPGR